MPDRDLGNMGESAVEGWAHQRRIVPNRVHYDKKGWDLILEFPRIKSANNPVPVGYKTSRNILQGSSKIYR